MSPAAHWPADRRRVLRLPLARGEPHPAGSGLNPEIYRPASPLRFERPSELIQVDIKESSAAAGLL